MSKVCGLVDVRQLQSKLGINREELAKMVGAKLETVKSWERSGASTKKCYLKRLLELMGRT